MTRKNLKVTEDVFEQHNEQRKEKGLTWSEYLRRLEFEDGSSTDSDTDVSYPDEVDLSPVLNRLDDIEAQLPRKVAEELR